MKRPLAYAAVALLVGGAGLVAGPRAVDALTASCASLSPGGSFDQAAKASEGGCTITVPDGNYPTQVLTLDPGRSGLLTFKGGRGAVVASISTGNPTPACGGAHDVVFEGLRVTRDVAARCGSENVTYRGIKAAQFQILGGSNVRVLDGDFGPLVDTVNQIKGGNVNALVEGNFIHDVLIADPSNHSECVHVWSGSGLRFVRNVLQNCTDFGIFIKGEGGATVTNAVVENNFIEGPMPGGIATTTCNPGCPRSGSSIRFSASSGPVSGSARFNSVLGGVKLDAGTQTTGIGNISTGFGQTNVGTNKKLDLHLVAGASAINACASPAPAIDIDSQGRTDGKPDCGADEFSGSAPIPTETTPTETTPTETTPTETQPTETTPTEPPPLSDRSIFCNESVPNAQAESNYNKWLAQNPGEKSRWEAYRDAVCAGQNPPPPTMTTPKGRGLVAAGKMATN